MIHGKNGNGKKGNRKMGTENWSTRKFSSTPPLSFLQASCSSCRPTNSVKALKPYVWLIGGECICSKIVLLILIVMFFSVLQIFCRNMDKQLSHLETVDNPHYPSGE